MEQYDRRGDQLRVVVFLVASVVGFLPWSANPAHLTLTILSLIMAVLLPTIGPRIPVAPFVVHLVAYVWLTSVLLLVSLCAPVSADTAVLRSNVTGADSELSVAISAAHAVQLSGTLIYSGDAPTVSYIANRLVLESNTKLLTVVNAVMTHDAPVYRFMPVIVIETILYVVVVFLTGSYPTSIVHVILWWAVPLVWFVLHGFPGTNGGVQRDPTRELDALDPLGAVQPTASSMTGPHSSTLPPDQSNNSLSPRELHPDGVAVPMSDSPVNNWLTKPGDGGDVAFEASATVIAKDDLYVVDRDSVWMLSPLTIYPQSGSPLDVPKLLLDHYGRVERCNETMVAFLGLPGPYSVVGRSFLSVLEWMNVEHLDVVSDAVSNVLSAVSRTAESSPGGTLTPSPVSCRILWRSSGVALYEEDHPKRVAFVAELVQVPGGAILQPPPSHSLCFALPAPACFLDRDGTILAWNTSMTQLLDWHPFDVLGMDAYNVLFGTPDHPMMKPASFPFLGEMQVTSKVDRLTETRTFDFALLEWNHGPTTDSLGILCLVMKSRGRRRGDAPVIAALGRLISDFNLNASDFRKTRVDRLEEFCDGVIGLVGQLAALDTQKHLRSESVGSNNSNDKDQEIAAADDADADAPPGAWGKLTSQDTSICPSCYLTSPVGKEFRAGRSAQCHVVVRDSFVSSVQFTIHRKAAANAKDISFILTDRSANGTFVNVRSVGKDRTRTLRSGDLINFRLSNSRFFLGFRFDVIDHGHKVKPPPGPGVHVAATHPNDETPRGATFEWKIGEEMLGKGGNAEVFLGINLTNGKLIAVKRVALPRDAASRRQYDSLLEEMAVLSTASHNNIVQYYGASQSATHMHILLEFVPGGSIRHLLNNFGALSDRVTLRYLKQMLQGLNYLHSRRMVHGDLKCANVLVTDKGVVKITDFGTAQIVKETKVVSDGTSTTLHGTLLWMAPELVRGSHDPSTASDMWSIGCCVLEMLSGSYPWSEYDFENDEQITNLLRYADEPPEIPQTNSAVLHTIAHECLQMDPELRPSAAKLLEMLSADERGLTLPAASALADAVIKAKGNLSAE